MSVQVPDVAPGLPSSWYSDEAVFRQEVEQILRPGWQAAAHLSAVSEPGDFVATDIHDVPVLVVRDCEGELRGFVNACRHRGHAVATGTGNRRVLRCPYHAWTYALDGRLRSIPRYCIEDEATKAALGLQPVRVGLSGEWVFASLAAEGPSLEEGVAGFPEYVAEYGLTFDGLERSEQLEYVIEANWKVVAENNSECYHCPTLHPETFSTIVKTRPDQFKIRTQGNCIAELTEIVADRRRSDLHEADRRPVDAQFYILFPTTSISRDDYLSTIMTWHPRGPRQTVMRVQVYTDPEAEPAARAEWLEFYDRTFTEDLGAMRSVQRAMNEQLVDRTVTVPEFESGVAHFHQLIRSHLEVS